MVFNTTFNNISVISWQPESCDYVSNEQVFYFFLIQLLNACSVALLFNKKEFSHIQEILPTSSKYNHL